MNRRSWLSAALLVPTPLMLPGCAPFARPDAASDRVWTGRLLVRIETETAQGFSAAFELVGDARAGTLVLLSPLGSTLARMRWSATEAVLQADGGTRRYGSVDELIRAATGTELPLEGLFTWLGGGPARFDGWSVSQDDRPAGRLRARRATPEPAVELRLALD